MKTSKRLLLIFVLSLCALSAFAQKQLRYIPKAVQGTKVVPYVVNPRLLPAVRANFAMPVVRPNLAPTLERAVTAQTVQATVQRSPLAILQKDFLTGPQALQTFRPGWKSELMLSGFTRRQLDLVEQAFKETDQFLFETDEAGNWLSPRSAEWNYTDRFAKILTDNAFGEMSLNDGQIKTLFGKFSRLDDVFTRLNEQSFIAVHQRAPKANAPGEEGKLARHIKYNIDKRHPALNPEVEEYIYGKMPAKLHTPKPSYGPKTISPSRTPEQVWEEVTRFMREHDGEIPSVHAEDDYERKLRKTWDNIYYKKQTSNDPYVKRLIQLHNETVKQIATGKTPQAWLETIEPWVLEHKRWPFTTTEEENAMYEGAKGAMRNNPDDPASVRLKELKETYFKPWGKTPQAWLAIIEPWVMEHGCWPSQYNEEEKVMYGGAQGAIHNHPEDPASMRLKELKEIYFQPRGKTSQEWLAIIEPWVMEHKHWPTYSSEEEKAMYRGADNIMRNKPDDPVSVRLKELKEQFGKKKAEK